MPAYPKLDLPPLEGDWDLRLQSAEALDTLHTVSESESYFYGIAHKAVMLGIEASFDTPQFRHAVDTGAKAFESLGHLVDSSVSYGSFEARALTLKSAQAFAASHMDSDAFIASCDYARQRMQEDAPQLTETITDVVSPHMNYDKVAVTFALRGAAAMRGMQIFVDKRLEAA